MDNHQSEDLLEQMHSRKPNLEQIRSYKPRSPLFLRNEQSAPINDQKLLDQSLGEVCDQSREEYPNDCCVPFTFPRSLVHPINVHVLRHQLSWTYRGDHVASFQATSDQVRHQQLQPQASVHCYLLQALIKGCN